MTLTKLTNYPYALHFGLLNYHDDFTRFVVDQRIPTESAAGLAPTLYLVSDGDSFLTWGETGPDATFHLIVGLNQMPSTGDVCDIAFDLAGWVMKDTDLALDGRNLRLIDYAVLTDTDDWGCLRGVDGQTRVIPTLRPVM